MSLNLTGEPITNVPIGELGGTLYDATSHSSYQHAGGLVYPQEQIANVAHILRQSLPQTKGRVVSADWRDAMVGGACGLLLGILLCAGFAVIAWGWSLRMLDVLSGGARWGGLLGILIGYSNPSISDRFRKYFPLINVIVSHNTEPLPPCASAERVICIAFHPHSLLLAFAVAPSDSNAAVVRLYDTAEQQIGPLTLVHPFQVDVRTVSWKPHAKDVLLVGCRGGVLAWHLSFFGVEQAACVFFQASQRVPVTSISWANQGRVMAAGSKQSTKIHLFDIARPSQHSLLKTFTNRHGVNQVQFLADADQCLMVVSSGVGELQLWDLTSNAYSLIPLRAPALQLSPLFTKAHDASRTVAMTYVVQFEAEEGIALVRVKRAGSHRAAEVHLLAAVSTSRIDPLKVGGLVQQMQVSNGRVFLKVRSGHIIVLKMAATESCTSALCVGSFPVSDDLVMATCPSFPRGSLLAYVTDQQRLRFLPCYHCDSAEA